MTATDAAQRFADQLATSLADGFFVRLVLSAPRAAPDAPPKVLGRAVQLKGQLHLSLTFRHATRDVTKNLPISQAAAWARAQLESAYRRALLCTTKADWQFVSQPDGTARFIKHPPQCRRPPSQQHDQPRAGLLDARARDWLEGLGVLDTHGKVRASMADKYCQINRYLEIVAQLAADCGWAPADAPAAVQAPGEAAPAGSAGRPAATALPPAQGQARTAEVVTIADMGCGKGYLTFGLWHLFRRVWRRPVRVIGVEMRAELVTAANRLAGRIGAEGLEFVAGDIASASLPPLDALIALHACNTATDDALRRGIAEGARLLVVAPCCHKAVRPQLGRPEPLAGLLRHGLLEERFAEWLTDGLRALFLEWAGFRTKVLEFVGTEHTPKNLMLAAVRARPAFADEAVRRQIQDLKAWCGLQHHALDALLQADAPPASSQPTDPTGCATAQSPGV